MVVGRKRSWKPSGAKAQKNNRYRDMHILAWGWMITHNSVRAAAAAYRVAKGMVWYNLVPVLVVDGFHLICIHRFLLYKHPKVG